MGSEGSGNGKDSLLLPVKFPWDCCWVGWKAGEAKDWLLLANISGVVLQQAGLNAGKKREGVKLQPLSEMGLSEQNHCQSEGYSSRLTGSG